VCLLTRTVLELIERPSYLIFLIGEVFSFVVYQDKREADAVDVDLSSSVSDSQRNDRLAALKEQRCELSSVYLAAQYIIRAHTERRN